MRYLSLWAIVAILLCIGGRTLANPETDTYIIMGKQGQSLQAKNYAAYMKWFAPGCAFADNRDFRNIKPMSATQWQQMIQREIGDATVIKAEAAPGHVRYQQYLTLKTPAGERKIIYLRLTYDLTKTPTGLIVNHAYLDRLRTSTAGRYSDETALLGKWAHVEYTSDPLLQEMDIEFFKDGTIMLTPISGRDGGPVSGTYRLIDTTHLRIEARGTVEVWTIERPTLTLPPHNGVTWKSELVAGGVPAEAFVYKFPKNYYLVMTTQAGRKVYLSR
jgi:hypothetical protein